MTRLSAADLARFMGPTPALEPPQDASTATRKPGKAGMRVPSHPGLSGAFRIGQVGAHLHRFRWCKAWAQWVSVCGIGKHGEPQAGQGERCVVCYREEAV